MYIVNDNVFFSNKCYKISDLTDMLKNIKKLSKICCREK
jgi:hypothetical protein